MKKKAILSISFGTDNHSAAEQTIDMLEKQYLNAWPSCELYSAVTNPAVIHQMKEDGNYDVYAVREIMARMVLDGITHLYVQPSYLMPGVEYDALLKMVNSHKADFVEVKCGLPLLASHEDMQRTCAAIMEDHPALEEDEAVVVIGHGSRHHTNTMYCALDYVFKDLGGLHFYAGTFNAYPQIDTVIRHLKNDGIHKVHIAPFMFVAGLSALDGVCGDAADSMASQLKAAGFEVRSNKKCLGEYDKIRQIYLDHLASIME